MKIRMRRIAIVYNSIILAVFVLTILKLSRYQTISYKIASTIYLLVYLLSLIALTPQVKPFLTKSAFILNGIWLVLGTLGVLLAFFNIYANSIAVLG